jgi:hypothetical protein
MIEELEQDPQSRISIVPKFEPDTAAQLRALQGLQRLDTERKGDQS